MRKYVGLVAVVALAGLLRGSAPQDGGANQGKFDRDRLQGTWVLTSLENRGQTVPAELFKQVKMTVTFRGDKMKVQSRDDQEEEGTYTVDTNKSPRVIIVNMLDDKKVFRGIYAFDGDDVLKICGSDAAEAPREFKTQENSQATLMIFKREKK